MNARRGTLNDDLITETKIATSMKSQTTVQSFPELPHFSTGGGVLLFHNQAGVHTHMYSVTGALLTVCAAAGMLVSLP